MRILIAAIALLISGSAFAQNEVKASAYRMDLNLRLYEVCGTLSGPNNGGRAVELVADPKRNPGHYMTSTNSEGKFCTLMRIYGTELVIKVSDAVQTLTVN